MRRRSAGSREDGATRIGYLAMLAIVGGLAACASMSGTGSVQKLDARNGFRDAHFGVPVSAIPNLELVESRNGFDCYQRADEDLTIGEATLTHVRYCFAGGKLATIVMSALGVTATQELLRSLRASYGPGEPVSARAEDSPPMGEMWRGKHVTAMLLFVQRDTFALSVTGDVSVSIWSNALVAERAAPAHPAPAGP